MNSEIPTGVSWNHYFIKCFLNIGQPFAQNLNATRSVHSTIKHPKLQLSALLIHAYNLTLHLENTRQETKHLGLPSPSLLTLLMFTFIVQQLFHVKFSVAPNSEIQVSPWIWNFRSPLANCLLHLVTWLCIHTSCSTEHFTHTKHCLWAVNH